VALNRVCLNVVTDCEIVKIASRELAMDILDVRFIDESNVRHLIKIPINLIKSELISYPFNRFNIIKIDKNFCIVEIWKSPCSICRLLQKENIYMIKARSRKPSIINYIFTCDEHTLGRIKDKLIANKLEHSIDICNEHSSKILTDTQEYVLSIALEMGYFDYPHKITLKELSKVLDISPSTLNEILRRAIKKIVTHYLTISKEYQNGP